MLAAHNVEDARLEGEILLRHALGLDRARLYSDLDAAMSVSAEDSLLKALDRRLGGEPSAYITGHREFYGLDFFVDRHVLVPRPETELLVEKAIGLAREHGLATVADVGTGCGAIAISLAVNLPGTTVYAIDLSPKTLEVARRNASRHRVRRRIHFLEGDLLEPLPHPVDLLVSNLPYVKGPDIDTNNMLKFEPRLALNGGEDGLEAIRKLCRQVPSKLRPGGFLLLEIGRGQGKGAAGIIHANLTGATIEIFDDLAGIERLVIARLT
ncbi:MAG: protein-(glutamine-N5) methyltransferase, release factor-specific [Chloroflexi bacterium RBG_16_58_8]|nr:MAG: protein-(glutamine-N5) methyltransferase, release factor-specific [Chloroflexi bacterium RBG_16_58_8]